MKSKWLWLALLTLVACGTSKTPVQEGTEQQILHLSRGSEPQTLDLQLVHESVAAFMMTAMFEGLVAHHPQDLSYEPGVATSWTMSNEGKTYTFNLRADAKWSNGDPVTAQDFVMSWERLLHPKLGATTAEYYYCIEGAEAFNKGTLSSFDQVGVKAVDATTLVVKLNQPTPYFLQLMQHYSSYPVHVASIKKHGDWLSRENPWTRPGNMVSNGAFVLKDWQLNKHIIVEQNPHYWDRSTVKLKAVHFHSLDNTSTEDRLFNGGGLHVSNTVLASKMDKYKSMKPTPLRIEPYFGIYYFELNVNKKPLDDKRVRKALAMAVNRESIIKNVTKGDQISYGALTPPLPNYRSPIEIPYDPEQARRLLAEAGYPGGQGFPPLELTFDTSENHQAIAVAMQQMFKTELGIDVTLTNQEWKVFLDSLASKNFEIARYAWIGDFVDPTSFLQLFLTGNANNYSGWSNAEYDRLFKQAGLELDPNKRLELLKKAEALVVEEAPFIPVYVYTRNYLIDPSVKGWWPQLLDQHPLKHVYLEASAP